MLQFGSLSNRLCQGITKVNVVSLLRCVKEFYGRLDMSLKQIDVRLLLFATVPRSTERRLVHMSSQRSGNVSHWAIRLAIGHLFSLPH